MSRSIAVLAALALVGSRAVAQSGVIYRLEPGSSLTEIFCLPPCACPSHQSQGPMSGTFTLTPIARGPLFDNYEVTSFDVVAMLPNGPQHVTGSGTYEIGGEVALVQRMQLLAAAGSDPLAPHTSGLVPVDPAHPFPRISITLESEVFGCRQNLMTIIAAPVPCQADCDGSGALDVLDFACFLNHFAAGDLYANCDGSTRPPRLNVLDFSCYLNRFAAGCP